jgi:hypothetical protein
MSVWIETGSVDVSCLFPQPQQVLVQQALEHRGCSGKDQGCSGTQTHGLLSHQSHYSHCHCLVPPVSSRGGC